MPQSTAGNRVRQKLDHYLSSEQYGEAFRICRHAVSEELLTHAEALPYAYQIGLLTTDDGVRKATIRLYESLILALGERGDLLTELGNLQITNEDTRKARVVLERALRFEKDEPNLSARHSLADILTDQGEYDEAAKVLGPVLKTISLKDQNSAPVFGLMGKIQSKRKNPRDAAVWYHKAITLDPNEPLWRRERALALEEMGEFRKALSFWNQILAISPMDMNKTALDAGRPVFKIQEYMKGMEFAKRHKALCERKLR